MRLMDWRTASMRSRLPGAEVGCDATGADEVQRRIATRHGRHRAKYSSTQESEQIRENLAAIRRSVSWASLIPFLGGAGSTPAQCE